MIDYSCATCKCTEAKLWRPMSVFAEDIKLICWECLENKGHHVCLDDEHPSDQVYNSDIEHTCWGPAVPDLDGQYWGYTSVPEWWVQWWKHLPDKASHCTMCSGNGRFGGFDDTGFDCYKCEGTGERNVRV